MSFSKIKTIERVVAVVFPMCEASLMFVNFEMMGFTFPIPTILTASGRW